MRRMGDRLSAFASIALATAFSGSPAQAADGPSRACKASIPLHVEALNPHGIRNYLSRFSGALTDPGDLICCLPEEYRRSYVISHSSDAAQEGVPNNPRVIFFTPKGSGNAIAPLKFAISLNGSHHQRGGKNLEMLFDNEARREAEYFDAEFKDGRWKMSERNPESCMNCHGGDRERPGRAGIGGPRTIFDPPGSWSRISGAFMGCTDNERALVKAVDAVTEKALRENPRYRCLEPTEQPVFSQERTAFGNDYGFNVAMGLDGELARLNDRRVLAVMRRTPDFDKYKYALVGSHLCATTMSASQRMFDVKKWLPPNVIARHTGTAGLRPEVASSTNLPETMRTQLRKMIRENGRIDRRQARELRRHRETGSVPSFEVSENPMACRGTKEANNAVDAMRPLLVGPALLDRYKVDTALRVPRATEAFAPDPVERFIFEGRGIDMSDWSTDARPGLYRRGTTQGTFAFQLLEAERADAPLGRLRERIFRQFRGQEKKSGPQESKDLCEELRKLSLNAWENDVRSPPAPATAPAPARR